MFELEAKNCFRRAEKSYEEAIKLINISKYAEAIDKFHDLVENSLKTLLNLYKISYKPTHDVTSLLPRIIEQLEEKDPNFYLYSEIVLPPFIVIHKMLKEIRNIARYGYRGISSERIFNEQIAKSIQIMIEGNYPMLKGWILEEMAKRKI